AQADGAGRRDRDLGRGAWQPGRGGGRGRLAVGGGPARVVGGRGGGAGGGDRRRQRLGRPHRQLHPAGVPDRGPQHRDPRLRGGPEPRRLAADGLPALLLRPDPGGQAAGMTRLLTLGHGTPSAGELVALRDGAGVERLVDVRTAPGSRRHPHVRRETMAGWLGEAGVAYRWEPELGGFRRALPRGAQGPDTGSVNTALRHPAFRGYADYMRTRAFWAALDRLLAEAAGAATAGVCSGAPL